MKHTSLGYLQRTAVLLLSLVLALQSELLLLLIMMTRHLFIHHVVWNQTSHKKAMSLTLQM
jgi:hypothetical protein